MYFENSPRIILYEMKSYLRIFEYWYRFFIWCFSRPFALLMFRPIWPFKSQKKFSFLFWWTPLHYSNFKNVSLINNMYSTRAFGHLKCQLFNFEKWILPLQNHLVKHLHYIMFSTETYIVLRMSSSIISRRC